MDFCWSSPYSTPWGRSRIPNISVWMEVPVLQKLQEQRWIALREAVKNSGFTTFEFIDSQDDFTCIWRNSSYPYIRETSHFKHNRQNFTVCDTAENYVEVFLHVFSCLVTGPSTDPRSEIIAIYGNFCFPDHRNNARSARHHFQR